MRRGSRPVLRVWFLAALTGCSLWLTLACAIGQSTPQASPSAAKATREIPSLAKATVLKVIDGVTLDVEIDGRVHRLRYLGLSAPDERPGPSLGRSPGREASAFNRFLVEGRSVELERDAVDSDQAGNLLRYVYVGGEMANLTLLLNGLATVADSPAAFKYQTEFLMAEESARSSQRGVWSLSAPGEVQGPASPRSTPTAVPRFSGGTLPRPPSSGGVAQRCDFSGTSEPVIKGNVDSRTGGRVYHVPGGLLYSTTVVDETQGDRWFCTEAEAVAAGWKRSTH